jgi:hypothetical protein
MSLTRPMMAQILKLPNERIIVVTKEGYSLKLAKYFKGKEGEHYVLKSDYLIAKTYINQTVFWLKAHIEIYTFLQGNKFAPSTLMGIIQIVEKGIIN